MSIRINGIDNPSTLDTKAEFAHSTYHLSQNDNLYEVQRSNNFEFIIPAISEITGDPSSSEMVRLSVQSCPIPHFTQTTIEIKRGNNTIKAAGVPTFDSGTVTCNDYIGTNTKELLLKWQYKSYNPVTEKVGLMSDYKIDCYLCEYTPDYQLVRQWILEGCWISGLQESEYSYESNDKKTIQVTIQYDRAKLGSGGIA